MAKNPEQELKALTTRLSSAQADYEVARMEAQEAQRKAAECQKKVDSLKAQIAALKKDRPSLIVTEHAIVRFMERALNIDLEEIKRKIAPPEVHALVAQCGNGRYPVGDFKIVVRDNTVVTVEAK